MTEEEMRMDMLIAELDAENRTLKRELSQVHAILAWRLEEMFPRSDTIASIATWIRDQGNVRPANEH